MIKPEHFNHASTYLIAKEAERRGIKVKRLISQGPYAGRSIIELKFGVATEYMVAQRTSKTDSVAYWLQKNKYYAKVFFKRAGLSVAEGEIVQAHDTAVAVAYAHQIGFPVVVKKIDGIHGTDVYVNIRNRKELLASLKKMTGPVLIEKMHKGTEFRIFATKDKFVAATRRVPANVVGDGVSTIEQLIKKKNSDPQRSEGYGTGLRTIKIDENVHDTLRKQGLNLSQVPRRGQTVFLRENSNISTGGDSIDVTDLVHPDVKKLAVATIRSIPGLAYAGIDFMTNQEISEKPLKNQYIIIEVNDSPMISMHHYPYEGKERDAAGAIIDILFPGSKSKSSKRSLR